MKQTVLIFGGLALAILLLFQLSKYTLLTGGWRLEIVLAFVAAVFLALGYLLNRRSGKGLPEPAPALREDPAPAIAAAGLTEREYEVLLAISNGLSNREIGEQLFLAESTVKTHVSNLLTKLDAKRRTQAVRRARELKIL